MRGAFVTDLVANGEKLVRERLGEIKVGDKLRKDGRGPRHVVAVVDDEGHFVIVTRWWHERRGWQYDADERWLMYMGWERC